MRPSTPFHTLSSSSRAWLSRQNKDPYVKGRLSSPVAYRSRSAFKLIEIDAKWDNFLAKPHVGAVVDLGAAPGGWSQVVAEKLGWGMKGEGEGERLKSEPKLGSVRKGHTNRGELWNRHKRKDEMEVEEELRFDPLNIEDEDDGSASQPRGRGTIVAVDLLPMNPIHGVLDVRANFLKPETGDLVHRLLSVKGNPGGEADIILSDMAANLTGNQTADIESSLEICESVYEFATQHLRTAETIGKKRGGILLMKFFTHPRLQEFRQLQLHPNFNDVRILKPQSSRSESKEAYFLCRGWKGLH